MSTNRITRLTRRRARALLDQPLGGGVADGALGRVLAAAGTTPAADATDAELSAVMHFRAVTPALRSTARRPSMIKSLLTKLVATKLVAGAAVAAAATGGMALAAADGQFSTTTQLAAPALSTDASSSSDAPSSDAPTSSTPPADDTSTGATDSTSPTDSASPTDPASPTDGTTDSTAPDPSTSPTSSDGPHPSLHGLCVAFNAGVSASHGKALRNPAFTVLITAAGGLDSVGSYCATVLGSAAPTATDSEPTTHGHGNGNGNGHGNGHGKSGQPGTVTVSGSATVSAGTSGHGNGNGNGNGKANGHGNGGQADVQGGLTLSLP
jgi:hypothetical protein